MTLQAVACEQVKDDLGALPTDLRLTPWRVDHEGASYRDVDQILSMSTDAIPSALSPGERFWVIAGATHRVSRGVTWGSARARTEGVGVTRGHDSPDRTPDLARPSFVRTNFSDEVVRLVRVSHVSSPSTQSTRTMTAE